VYQPDIVFVAKENGHLIKENGLYGAPDMVIEILSPSTEKYDKGPKKDIYEQYGVKEYWIVEPTDKSVTGYALQNNKLVTIATNTGMMQSLLLNHAFVF
jgi:Uma2 family endonuclease